MGFAPGTWGPSARVYSNEHCSTRHRPRALTTPAVRSNHPSFGHRATDSTRCITIRIMNKIRSLGFISLPSDEDLKYVEKHEIFPFTFSSTKINRNQQDLQTFDHLSRAVARYQRWFQVAVTALSGLYILEEVQSGSIARQIRLLANVACVIRGFFMARAAPRGNFFRRKLLRFTSASSINPCFGGGISQSNFFMNMSSVSQHKRKVFIPACWISCPRLRKQVPGSAFL